MSLAELNKRLARLLSAPFENLPAFYTKVYPISIVGEDNENYYRAILTNADATLAVYAIESVGGGFKSSHLHMPAGNSLQTFIDWWRITTGRGQTPTGRILPDAGRMCINFEEVGGPRLLFSRIGRGENEQVPADVRAGRHSG